MIDEIHVKDIALIREGYIEPSAGMTAITGETGTGKTALLAACRLIMGERATRSLVREGAQSAQVEARLFAEVADGADDAVDISGASGNGDNDASDGNNNDGNVGINDDAGNGNADGSIDAAAPQATAFPDDALSEWVVARSISADGRSRVRINGELASVAALAEYIAPMIDLCSQHDQQTLLNASAQRRMLDIWCGNDSNGLLDTYRDAYRGVGEAKAALDGIIADGEVSSNKLNDARIVLREVDSVNPTQQDYDELMAALRISENAEALARISSEALAALNDEGGALDSLNGASALLDNGAKLDPKLSSLSAQIKDALFTTEDVAREIATYQSAIDLDVGELSEMQDRASAYQSLMRAYGPTIDDVVAHAEEARRIVAVASDSGELEAKARRALEDAESALAEAAKALSASRAKGARRFGGEVTKVMGELEMQSASLACTVEATPREKWTAAGADDVAFMFSPGENMQHRPLARIASGGELSRVMLAIHVVMGERDSVPTLVFDEIDAGVGGVTAVALAKVLSKVAATHQVIVVTHLPQIAACADRHYVVAKTTEGQGGNGSEPALHTEIKEVAGDARTYEIARMLSGSTTEASLAHAKELLTSDAG